MHAPNLSPSDAERSLGKKGGARRGFTLIELLGVIAIMILMMLAAGPLLSGIKGGRDPISQAYEIAGALEMARSYAVANNTYAWVGFCEEDGSKSTPVTSGTGTGRVIVSVVASKTGLRPVSVTQDLVQVSQVFKFDNLHLGSIAPVSTAESGNKPTRPGVEAAYQVGSTTFASTVQFTYPITGTVKYTFTKVVQFSPTGEARRLSTTMDDPLQRWLEVGLVPTHASVIDTHLDPDFPSAVLVEGVTGRVRIFKL